MPEKSIFDEFMTPENGPAKTGSSSKESNIFDEFMTSETKEEAPAVSIAKNINDNYNPGAYVARNIVPGVAKGIVNVGNTLGQGAAVVTDTIDRLFKNPNRNFAGQNQENINRVNKLYNDKYGDNTGAKIGEVGGEVLATTPLIPMRALTGVKTAMGAMPTILSTGEKIAAPIANRLGASAVTGGIAGGEFGALTSAGHDKSLPENVGTNALAGLVGGPVVEGAGKLASKVMPFIRNLTGNAAINTFANKYGITPNSAKRVMSELQNEGMSLSEAEAQLLTLGKDSTIGDLTPGLQKFVGALAQRGGRAQAIVENRYAQRAENADNVAHKIMESKLGPKPDVVLERGKLGGAEADAIHKEAQMLTKADYDAAKLNPKNLDIKGVITDINDKLESAVGDKKSILAEAKNYMYRVTKDPVTGKEVKTLKNSVKDLHEVREGLDGIIENRGDKLHSKALGAIETVRKQIDRVLKTIPEMASADAKFAEKMNVKEGLKIGYEALKKGNKEQFEKTFNAASPELKETIRKGMHAHIGDMMEQAANGELAGAQQLFKKRTATREKLKTAFGSTGEEILDALATQAVLRRTEKMASEGSRTAVNTRINALLDNEGKSSGVIGELVKGAAIDLSTGASGAATAVMGAKRTGGNIINKLGQVRKDANVESFADLISRSGKDLSNATRVLRTVDKIQKRIVGESLKVKLPVALSSPVGNYTIDTGKDIKNKLQKLY